MKRTPLQELIEKVEHAIAYNLEGANVKKYTWEDLHCDMCNLLEIEKEFIEDVFEDGLEEEYQFHPLITIIIYTLLTKI